jgi:bloom syndrome protein
MQVRVSPTKNGKEAGRGPQVKPVNRRRNQKDAVPASGLLSTFVSSPIQGATSRRKEKAAEQQKDSSDAFEDVNLHGNGYAQDGFVIEDDEDADYEDEMPPPISKLSLKNKKQQAQTKLGTPITLDAMMDDLSPHLRDVVESFLPRAKKVCGRIMKKNNMRSQPFSDTVLRLMFIHMPTSNELMCQIDGVNSEMVKLYGKKLIPLIKEAREFCPADDQSYEQWLGPSGLKHLDSARPHDPNHENVIDLVSDDEEVYNQDVSDEEDIGVDTVESPYFAPKTGIGKASQSVESRMPDKVAAFNAQLDRLSHVAASSRPANARAPSAGPLKAAGKGKRASVGSKGKSFRRAGSHGARGTSGGYTKKKTSSSRPKASKKSGVGSGFTSGGGGIGMMPI